MKRLSAAVFALGLLPGMPARAQQTAPDTAPIHELERTSYYWLAAETGGTIAFFAIYSIAAGDTPQECSWCEVNEFDRSVRDWIVMDDQMTPGLVSHAVSLGLVPVGAITALTLPALDAGKGEYAIADSWIVLNSLLLAAGFTDGTKKLFARQRPTFALGDPSRTELDLISNPNDEANLSFFSGDTAWAASVTASATSLAYLRGYWTAPWILGVGSGLTLTTGLLRMAGDMHWATDVMGGIVGGGLAGVALPLLLHQRSNAEVVALPMLIPRVDGRSWSLSVSGTF